MENKEQSNFVKIWGQIKKTIKRIFPNWETEAAIIIVVLAITITAACVMRTASNPNEAQLKDPIQQEQNPGTTVGKPEIEISGTESTDPQTYTIEYQTSQMCFIGDSRTVAMEGSVITDVKFIAKSSMGLDWFNETASVEFEKNKDNIELCVVALGINDIWKADDYIARLNSFAEQYPNKVFIYANVGPVNEELYTGIPNKTIEEFNKKMQEGLSDRWQIVDQYTFLSAGEFDTNDGLHYSLSDSAKIFAWIVDSVKTQTVTKAQ